MVKQVGVWDANSVWPVMQTVYGLLFGQKNTKKPLHSFGSGAQRAQKMAIRKADKSFIRAVDHGVPVLQMYMKESRDISLDLSLQHLHHSLVVGQK